MIAPNFPILELAVIGYPDSVEFCYFLIFLSSLVPVSELP